MKTIAFIGIDGAGKTTILKGLLKKFEEENIKCGKRYMGLGREYQLKWIEFLIRIYHNNKKNNYKKGKINIESNYRERSFFWVLVQYIELWARFIREKLSKKKIVLFDRYFYDGLILGNKKAFSFFRKITPKPTKCFLIYASPQIIRKRKQEAEIKDIKKFYKKINELKKYFDIEVVNNNKDLEKVISKIKSKIKNV